MSTDCHIWKGAIDRDGYGLIRHNGKTCRLHRVAYCEFYDVPLDSIRGKVVLHSCDTPSCYNPAHLSLGTQADNMRDCVNKGRLRRHDGEFNSRAKLNLVLATAIRKDYASIRSYALLASKYGVGKSTIARVIKGDLWND